VAGAQGRHRPIRRPRLGFTSQAETLDPEDVEKTTQVRRALEFYRSVGATLYIKRAEALLPASA
jgi:hypothetical protein